MAGDIVSGAAWDWMQTPALLEDGTTVMHADSTVGFGWRSGLDGDGDGDRTAHHAGIANGARSVLVLYPDLQVAVSVLSNALWVSSIEQTATVLAAPFKPAAAGARVACPTQSVTYQGEYDGKPLSGTARVSLCTATISVKNGVRRLA